jgi:hypothetical protein
MAAFRICGPARAGALLRDGDGAMNALIAPISGEPSLL